MRVVTWGVPFLIVTCATTGQLRAQERHVKRSALPAAVQRTVDEQSAGAKIRGYSREVENGQTEYEVELTVNGHGKDVSIAPDGSVLEIEEEVALDSLPEAVRTGLKQLAGSGRIGKVESLTKHGALVGYEAQVRSGAKRSEIQVGPDGKRLAHPE